MQWIKKSLMEMREIKVGMTRADLFKVFKTESGLSSNVNRTYVYRDSSYIKINVEFEPVKLGGDAEEADDDLIKNISKPYIGFGVIDHTYWLDKILIEIQRVKVGMTREDLLKILTTEGGTSTVFNRTYVYPEIPYIKIDVEFAPIKRPAPGVHSEETDEDLIKKISKPYLEFSIVD